MGADIAARRAGRAVLPGGDVMQWWIFSRRYRLALPVEMPTLDIERAIVRGWHVDGHFLVPNPERFLTTQPYLPHNVVIVPRIPRED